MLERICIPIVVAALSCGVTALALGETTSDTNYQYRLAAGAAVQDHLGVLLWKKEGSAPVKIAKRCAPDRGRWAGWRRCKVRVLGTSRCRMIVHARPDGNSYAAWAEKLRCH